MTVWLKISAVLFLLVAGACSNSANDDNADNSLSEAQQVLQQFGELQDYFTEEAIQALLDYEDSGRPVTLLQLMSITDDEIFERYEEEAAALWESIGASERFRSEVFEQLIGDRSLDQSRAIEFPNIMVLVSAIDSPAFIDLMNTLAAASDDHVWVLGEEDPLPFTPSGSYFDPALQNLNRDNAIAVVEAANDGSRDLGLDSDPEAIIDMVVSDAPGPFWMVNLIDHYEQATFPDGRDTDLSGAEADAIYGNAILPTLLQFNSLPELVMPVAIVLTDEEIKWEEAAIVRYASRDAFLNAFPLNPQADEALIFKEAGVENTLVYASEVPGTVLPAPQSGPLFNFRYCEVLLFDSAGGADLRADVYNSMPLSDCPQNLWDALDAEQIASDFSARAAALNGIRFWVLDAIEAQLPPGLPVIENFGGITMRLAASVDLAPGSGLNGAAPYEGNFVSRNTVWHYVAGRQVYELENPDGVRYRMQSFTRGQDPDQQLVDLQRLEQKLELPMGWSFHVRLLEEDSELLTVEGIAEVIVDDLGNTYQRVP
ncbi:DUF1330 domain-containing protein [Candidatus Marimicrobium litorale]|jgi:uncharacterized protein (DUF1330 family)|nr:DUF1330 domain-containing protein [Candidatus Marimicrobium litorale]